LVSPPSSPPLLARPRSRPLVSPQSSPLSHLSLVLLGPSSLLSVSWLQ
ncbi:hypothetical protein ANOM_006900, partial [Aspergillus nomiae NRRL 13137]